MVAGMATPLDPKSAAHRVAAAQRRLDRAAAALEEARADRNDAIVAALDADVEQKVIAEQIGVTKSRMSHLVRAILEGDRDQPDPFIEK